MDFKWVTLQVEDMDKSLAFYRDIVGLRITEEIKTADTEIYFLGEGSTRVELISSPEAGGQMGPSISLGFGVKDLDGMMAFIKAKGLDVHSGPFSPSPGIRFFYLLDPSGLRVQFVEFS